MKMKTKLIVITTTLSSTNLKCLILRIILLHLFRELNLLSMLKKFKMAGVLFKCLRTILFKMTRATLTLELLKIKNTMLKTIIIDISINKNRSIKGCLNGLSL